MILQDSGLAAQAAKRGHFYALMGFETNNLLHPDWPAHWHFAYYQGATFAAKAYLPHVLLNDKGRNTKTAWTSPAKAARITNPANQRFRGPTGFLTHDEYRRHSWQN